MSVIVHDPDGDPVAGADIDIKIPATGVKIFTPHDRTDSQGLSPSAVPAGTYTIQVDPPPGTIFDRAILESVPVLNDTTVVVVLPEVPRITATGSVVDESGAGLADVRFDARLLPGGTAVYIPDDATDTEGSFALSLPMGTYDILVGPPPGARQVGLKLANVPALSDSVWGEITLADGWLVDVTVTSEQGLPVAGADLDFLDAATGEEVYTPHDNTDDSGLATVAVPAGTYRLVIEPLAGSGLRTLTVEDVTVSGDTAVAYTLAPAAGSVPQPVTIPPNQPNPFNGGTVITYTLAAPAEVTVAVYDLRGRLIAELRSGPHEVGSYTTAWDGRDQAGTATASGTYILRVQTTVGTQTRKMALVR